MPRGVYLYLNKDLKAAIEQEMKERGYESYSSFILSLLKERYGVK